MELEIYNYLKSNDKVLNLWAGKQYFMCDFETLTMQNIKKTEKGNKYSQVYLWGIHNSKISNILWGTNIDDFLATINLLVAKQKLKKFNFTFYFHNFNWDYQFIKNKLFDIDKIITNYNDFRELKKLYLKGEKKYENFYYMIKSGDRIILLRLLKYGNVITFQCSYRKTNLSVANMGKILEKYNVKTPQKLKDFYDYDLVEKVHSRKEFFEMVYGKTKNYDFSSSDIGIGKYSHFLKYLENDLIIPLKYLWFNKKIVLELNKKLSSHSKNFKPCYIKTKAKKGIIYLGNESKKIHKFRIKLFNVRLIKIGEKINEKAILFIRKKNILIEEKKLLDCLNFETWLVKDEMQMLENFGCEFKILTWKFFDSFKVKEFLSSNSITISSFSFNGWKKWYGKKDFENDFGTQENNILSMQEYSIINRSYAGGMTNFNQNNMGWNKEKWNVISFDLNSSYPFEMLQKLPYGEPVKTKPKKDYVGFFEIKIFSFAPKKTWKNKIPPLFPKWKTKFKKRDEIKNFDYENKPKYLYNWNEKYGNFISCFDNEEWKKLTKYYKIKFKILNKIYFNTKYILKDFINVMKKVKLNAKTKGERDLGKLIMNSIYGKTAQKIVSEIDYYFDIENINEEKLIKFNNENAFENPVLGTQEPLLSTFKLINLLEIEKDKNKVWEKNYSFIKFLDLERNFFYIKMNKKIDDEYYQCRQIGAIITSRARWNLLDTIIKLGWKNVKYFDTDSIYFYNNLETKKAVKKVKIDEKKLGFWAYEKKIKKMRILGAKNYQLNYSYIHNGKKWEKKVGWEYVIAGLGKANAVFEKIGNGEYKDKKIIKNVNVKRILLDEGVVLNDPVDFELKLKKFENF